MEDLYFVVLGLFGCKQMASVPRYTNIPTAASVFQCILLPVRLVAMLKLIAS
jgi:hypothetical protein